MRRADARACRTGDAAISGTDRGRTGARSASCGGPSDSTGEHDLWYATRSPAGTWDTPVKAVDQTDVMAVSANVLPPSGANGGRKVLGIVFDRETGLKNKGAVHYTEVALPTAP